jgi:hypothetical protein
MSRTSTKIAATTTVAALGALGATAMSSGGARPAPAATLPKPAPAAVEVRTVVIRKTVHRTRRIKAVTRPAARPTTTPTARAVVSPATPVPLAPAPTAVAPVPAGPAPRAVAYAPARRTPRPVRSRTSGSRGKGASASYGGESEGRDREEHGDD